MRALLISTALLAAAPALAGDPILAAKVVAFDSFARKVCNHPTEPFVVRSILEDAGIKGGLVPDHFTANVTTFRRFLESMPPAQACAAAVEALSEAG